MSRLSPNARRARCAARSAPAGRRMPIFPPSWSASSPIPSSRDFAACCMSFPTTSASRRFSAPMSARLAGAGRPFDLCVRPDQIDKAIALADICPDVQFVLDHCGAPAIKERAEHPWREQHRRNRPPAERRGQDFRRRRLCRRARPGRVDDIRPYVEHAIGSFGWDRVVWGSDWPVCTLTASLSTWVAATHAISRAAATTSARACSATTRPRFGGSRPERGGRLYRPPASPLSLRSSDL